MANVVGDGGKNFIHRFGDGNVPPAGYTEILGVTTGDDAISGLDGDDIIFADAGNDLINGGTGADAMNGGAGNDTYVVDNASDTTIEAAGGGIDTVQSSVTFTLASEVENLTLTGAAAINGTGNSLTNIITGNSAANTLNGGAGADALTGGAGDDTYIVDNAGDTTVEGSNQGFLDTVMASVSYTLGAAAFVERLTTTDAAGTAAINLTGNNIAQELTGNSGANTLDGKGGADAMTGGSGDDIYVVDNAGDTTVELAAGGNDTVQSTVNYTLAGEVERLTLIGNITINATGNTLNNVLTGNNGINTIDGGTGADTMIGNDGNDTYVVDNGGDTVDEKSEQGLLDVVTTSVTYTLGAAAFVERLTTTSAAGVAAINLTGNNIAQELIGNAGANTLDGRGGADTMTGGGGNDIYVVANVGDTANEAVGGGIDTVQSSMSFTLGAEVENLALTEPSAINGTGNGLSNTITGNSAANTIDGGVGADTLAGGAGNDIYIVDNTGDITTESSGQGALDTVMASASYTLGAAAFIERLTTTSAAGTGAINLTGNNIGQELIGNAGVNTLDGRGGADTMTGGAGDDVYVVDKVADTTLELAGGGSDTVQSSVTYTLASEVENLTLIGNITINANGNGLNNVVTGNNGVNTIDGGAGADTMTGNAGNDTFLVDNALDTTVEKSEQGALDIVMTSVSYTLGAAAFIERLTTTNAAGTGTLNLTGNGIAQELIGNAGANTLDGRGGADFMTGGAGSDTYVVDNAGDTTVEASDGGTLDIVTTGVSYTLGAASFIERLTTTFFGGTGAINLTGNAIAQEIVGNAGANTLDGGGGADAMTGGAGNDIYIVDNAGDTTVEAAGGGDDRVESSVSFTLAGEIENLVLTGAAAIDGTGNNLNNAITGNGAANTLNGGIGADALTGGLGNDTYVVDNAGDVIVEASDQGALDQVNASVSYVLGAAAFVERLATTNAAGIAAINLTGNDVAQELIGNAGANTLNGGGGADAMTGGGGDDIYIVDNAGDTLVEAVGGGTDNVQSAITYTLGNEVENLTLLGLDPINGTGNTLNNVLTGSGAANALSGLGGNDTLNGGLGEDAMTGGAGDDTYVVDNSGDTTVEVAGGGTDLVQTAVTFTLASEVENLALLGTEAISGTGNTLGNVLTGNGEGNALDGVGGNDTLNGGNGDDILTGGTGLDTVNGEGGDDTLRIDLTVEIVAGEIYNGGADNDTLTGNVGGVAANLSGVTLSALENITGFHGGLTLTAAQLDTFTGTVQTGAITLSGSGVVDIANADVSTSTFNLSAAGNSLTLNDEGLAYYTVNGGAAADTVTIVGGTLGSGTLNGGGGADVLTAGSGSDTLNGGADGDTLTGAAGDDQLTGGAGLDIVNGGAGFDTLFINAAAEIVAGETYDGGADADMLNGNSVPAAASLANVTLTSLESISGFNPGLTLTAAQLDAFTGDINTGAITLSTAGTVDISDANVSTGTFNLSSAGANSFTLNDEGFQFYTINGGALADTVTVTGGFFDATVNGNAGNDTLTGGAGNDTLNGGADGDTLTGGAGGDTLNGGADNDTLTGGADGDLLTGGAGLDTVQGDAGDDELVINAAAEIVAGEIYNGGLDSDTLNGNAVAAAASLANVTLTSLESIAGFNSGLTLTAAQLDLFTGSIQTGAITLSTAGTVDISDAYVSTGTFSLSSAGANSFTLSDEGIQFYTINGGGAADTVTVTGGFFGATVNGNAGNDTLNGGASDDVLNGGADNDTLNGGGGADSLTGGAGLDTMQGDAGDDELFINAATEIVAGETYSGGLDEDTLNGNAVAAAASLVGVTLTALENMNGFNSGLTLTTSQLDAFTGSISTGAITLSNAGTVDISDAEVFTATFNLSSAGNNTFTIDDDGTSNFYTINGGGAVDTITIAGGFYGATVNGNAGNDTLTGGAGDDFLTGGVGTDTMNGGGGDDDLFIDDASEATGAETYNGGAGTGDTLNGNAAASAVNLSSATISNIETISGFSSGVTFAKAALNGFTGTLSTGTITVADVGAVNLSGATVATSSFTLAAAGNVFSITDDGSASYTINGGLAADTITIFGGFNGATVNGGGGNDTLTGGAASDFLTGGGGADTILGGLGDDTLFIDAASETGGVETYNGGGDSDTLDGSAAAAQVNLGSAVISNIEAITGFSGGVIFASNALNGFTGSLSTGEVSIANAGTVNLSAADVYTTTFKLSAAGNTLTLSDVGIASYVVNGGAVADTITIAGGSFGARLDGGGGNDTLTGGGGAADSFVFSSTANGTDTVTNFSGIAGGELDLLVFDDSLLNGTFDYLEADPFTGTGNTEARFVGGQLFVDTDGNGGANFTINLNGITATSLTEADFSFQDL